MRGPVAELKDFCVALQKDGLLGCTKPDGASVATRGARGAPGRQIHEARALPIQKDHARMRASEIAVAIRTNQGWFVDLGRAPALAGRKDGVRIDRATAKMNWLDAFGSAVLSVSVTRKDEASAERTEEDRRFCGLTADGVPSCTDELVVFSNGDLDVRGRNFSAEFFFDSTTGSFRVSADAPLGPYAFGVALRQGRYELPFAGIPSATERAAGALIGPFTSVESFCRESVGRRPRRCILRRGAWTREVATLEPRGGVLGVQLLRVEDNPMGETVEYCRIAIATRDGWYVTREDQRCQGGITGMFTVETKALSLQWIDGTTVPTCVLITHGLELRGENAERGDGTYVMFDAPYGLERARICSLPPNSPPRCSPEYTVGCRDYHRKWRKVSWSIEGGVAKIPLQKAVECDAGGSLGEPIR